MPRASRRSRITVSTVKRNNIVDVSSSRCSHDLCTGGPSVYVVTRGRTAVSTLKTSLRPPVESVTAQFFPDAAMNVKVSWKAQC